LGKPLAVCVSCALRNEVTKGLMPRATPQTNYEIPPRQVLPNAKTFFRPIADWSNFLRKLKKTPRLLRNDNNNNGFIYYTILPK
jgi:hypothetical protein